MAKEIILTPLAIVNYESIIAYLVNDWGPTVANNFIDRFEEVCSFLAENPEIYPFANRELMIQKCVLTKHNIIYFKETPDAIRILTIFDSRQDPKKLLSIFS